MSVFTGDCDLFVCDFCGVSSHKVFRTVMDIGYDRMCTTALYACLGCSIKKDNERMKNGLS
jgi:hypothetical protein